MNNAYYIHEIKEIHTMDGVEQLEKSYFVAGVIKTESARARLVRGSHSLTADGPILIGAYDSEDAAIEACQEYSFTHSARFAGWRLK